MKTKDVNSYMGVWLLCTTSFVDFIKGEKYLLTSTLEPHTYTALNEKGAHVDVVISDDDLLGNFTIYENNNNNE